MNKKLPKRVFVKWAEEGNGTSYLVVDADCEGLAGDVGGVEAVGIYELTCTGKLATKAEFQNDKLKAKKR